MKRVALEKGRERGIYTRQDGSGGMRAVVLDEHGRERQRKDGDWPARKWRKFMEYFGRNGMRITHYSFSSLTQFKLADALRV